MLGVMLGVCKPQLSQSRHFSFESWLLMDVRAYHSWTSEEEDALRRGVEKHGLGSWEVIRKDEEFGLTR